MDQVDVSDAWTCAPTTREDFARGFRGPTTCRKPSYDVTVAIVGEFPTACAGSNRVFVGATFESVGSCPASVEDGASRRARATTSTRATDGADFPVTFSGLSSCGDVAPLRAWVRSTCAAASGFTVSVTVSRTPRESDDAENRGARKKLSDCLRVPPATGLACPRDLASAPRPNTCPAPPNGDARAVPERHGRRPRRRQTLRRSPRRRRHQNATLGILHQHGRALPLRGG